MNIIREKTMEKWDNIRESIENHPGASEPRDIFESIIDSFFEEIEKLKNKKQELIDLLEKTSEKLECEITGKTYRCVSDRLPEEYCETCKLRNQCIDIVQNHKSKD